MRIKLSPLTIFTQQSALSLQTSIKIVVGAINLLIGLSISVQYPMVPLPLLMLQAHLISKMIAALLNSLLRFKSTN